MSASGQLLERNRDPSPHSESEDFPNDTSVAQEDLNVTSDGSTHDDGTIDIQESLFPASENNLHTAIPREYSSPFLLPEPSPVRPNSSASSRASSINSFFECSEAEPKFYELTTQLTTALEENEKLKAEIERLSRENQKAKLARAQLDTITTQNVTVAARSVWERRMRVVNQEFADFIETKSLLIGVERDQSTDLSGMGAFISARNKKFKSKWKRPRLYSNDNNEDRDNETPLKKSSAPPRSTRDRRRSLAKFADERDEIESLISSLECGLTATRKLIAFSKNRFFSFDTSGLEEKNRIKKIKQDFLYDLLSAFKDSKNAHKKKEEILKNVITELQLDKTKLAEITHVTYLSCIRTSRTLALMKKYGYKPPPPEKKEEDQQQKTGGIFGCCIG